MMDVRRALAVLFVSAAMLGACEEEGDGGGSSDDSDAGALPNEDGAVQLPDAAALLGDASVPDPTADASKPGTDPTQGWTGNTVIFSEQAGTWVVYRDNDNKAEALNQVSDSRIYVSPDGTKLLTGDDGTKVWRASDRSVITMIANSYPGGWLTNDRLLVSTASYSWRADLRAVNADGSNDTLLFDKPVTPADPPGSPDGKKVLFLEHEGGDTIVHTVDVDGSNLKSFSPSKGEAAFIAWSRDGRVVYALNSGGDGKLRVLSATLEGDRAVTDALTSIKGIRPWHPASHVLVASETVGKGGARIAKYYDVDLDSGAATEQPNWDAAGTLIEKIHLSPDGTKVLFTAGKEVKIADRDGSNAVKISSGYGATQIARW